MQRDVDHARAAALAKIDRRQCTAEGGSIRAVGMLGTPACVKPYADAGKTCADTSDCTGACKAPQGARIGARSQGTCQKDTHDLEGCYNRIERGKVVAGMCSD